VVIAIIGILAAMVFPVFARARESARKAVCLSNVKNLALAFQMYFADNNDQFPPEEHRKEAVDYFSTSPGVGGDGWMADDDGSCPHNAINGNPYLRYPVILDEYVKNRDVWMCPSAKMVSGALFINACVPNFLDYLRINEGSWGRDEDHCIKDDCYPPGWGGTVTDTILQGRDAKAWLEGAWGDASSHANKAFLQGISCNGDTRDLKLTAIEDVVNFVVLADMGQWSEMMSPGLVAYPDLCNAECGNCWCSDSWIEDCYDTISSGCPSVADCFLEYHTSSTMLHDKELMKRGTRHLGGSNLGFADGHAAWWNATRLLSEFAEGGDGTFGLWAWGPTSVGGYDTCGFTAGGEPILY
jgi:prepilin-type processing-associated H-X9-DG protein